MSFYLDKLIYRLRRYFSDREDIIIKKENDRNLLECIFKIYDMDGIMNLNDKNRIKTMIECKNGIKKYVIYNRNKSILMNNWIRIIFGYKGMNSSYGLRYVNEL
jgi:hypothetical protein